MVENKHVKQLSVWLNISKLYYRIQSDLAALLSKVEGKKVELKRYTKEVTDMSGDLETYNVMVKEKQDELSDLTHQIDTSSKLLQ